MSDPWTSVPAFGTRDPSRNYTVREGAYAIITNEHARIAIVRTATGLWLPGGGLEPKESHEAALRRELRGQGFDDANVVAYVNGVRISRAEATGLLKKYPDLASYVKN